MPADQNRAQAAEVLSSSTPALRAAQYVRMSTEHQQYSTENQREMIRAYADLRGIEVVRTYADEGKSGLRIDGRAALQQLLRDVETRQTDFSVILVYDVSRWGRFQDADESAYYEYLCRRAGMQVMYRAEQFDNDGSPVSTIVKGVKRAMAAEYSRELSAKVSAGQHRLIELGYRQGGTAGYGLRRVLVDQSGKIKGALLHATTPDQLVNAKRPKPLQPVTQEQIARMEHELGKVKNTYQQAEKTYGEDLLNLVVAKGYLARILANSAVRRYLNAHQPEVLQEFQRVVDAVALEPGPGPAPIDSPDTVALPTSA